MVDNVALRECLAQLDLKTGQMTELDVSGAVGRLRPKDQPTDGPIELLAEMMAFDFCEDYSEKATGWGTYFGPMSVMPDKTGQMVESPSVQRVTPEMLLYWSDRARCAKHPVMRARYAGLVWDFHKAVSGTSADPEMARIRVDSVVELANANAHEYQVRVVGMLRHALGLAISLNDSQRVEQVRDAVLLYEKTVESEGKPGPAGFSFDLLMGNKKVPLTSSDEKDLLKGLEDRLARATNEGGDVVDPWAAEAMAIRLAKYYRSVGKPEEVRRVLLAYGSAFERLGEKAAPLLALAWLQKVACAYRDFGLKEESDRILRKLRELGPKVDKDLKPMSTKVTISRKEMDDYVEALLEGGLDKALSRVAVHYTPQRDKVEAELKEVAKKAPMMFLVTAWLQDHKGRPIARLGPLDEDLNGRIIHQISQNIEFEGVFLRQVMNGLVNRYALNTSTLLKYLYRSVLFEDSKRGLIERGLQHYFASDGISALHVLIPQVEDAIRNLVELAGGTVFKPVRAGRDQGFHLKTLDELLRDERLPAVFGPDVPLYLRVLLTDPRGINLRNNVCHGISPEGALGFGLADRVIHSLLILARVREKDDGRT